MLPKTNRYIDVKNWFCAEIQTFYTVEEQNKLFWTWVEEVLGNPKMEILKDTAKFKFSEGELRQLIKGIRRLKTGMPFQYILGYEWFCGLKLQVNPYVLIPRPETEELVHWIKDSGENISSVIDLGTGSGAIALALKKLYPLARVYACDKSEDALRTAQRNAENLNLEVTFVHGDFTSPDFSILDFDVVVSNPPYIVPSQYSTLPEQVRNFEPSVALFTPEDDPLYYYRTILSKARSGQTFYFELGLDQIPEVESLANRLRTREFYLRMDFSGKYRMAKFVF